MFVTNALARWSQTSNRRRAAETAIYTAPWLAACGVLVAVVARHTAIQIAVIAGAVGAIAVAIAAHRIMRRRRHTPWTIGRELDRAHHTTDLLTTAVAIELRGAGDPVERVVLDRAGQRLPELDVVAVAPVRWRTSPAGAVAAVALAGLLGLTVATAGGGLAAPPSALGEDERAQLEAVAQALDALEQDRTLSDDMRAQMARARRALAAASVAQSGTAALAGLSEAARLLDAAAPALARSDDTQQLTTEQLADQLAKATAANDSARLAALAKEALRRAAVSLADAQQLADTLAAAATQQRGAAGDPWNADDPVNRRLDQLGGAADQMRAGDLDAARDTLSRLARPPGATPGAPPGTPPPDPRSRRLDAARAAIAALRSAQRSALNGMTTNDARAAAARAAASRPGAGSAGSAGAGAGSAGSGAGSGRSGLAAGAGSAGSGAGSGRPGLAAIPTAPGTRTGLGVVMPGGSAGTSGARVPGAPSGARSPDEVAAEQVATTPSLTPDGIIRAISEYSAGAHRSDQFDPVRDHYAAIAEAVIRRDQIPLTRRDFIQRYFEALRNQEAPR